MTSPGERVAERPDVGALGVHADRQVVDDAEPHPGLDGLPLGRRELLVEAPLQPHVERDPLGQLRAQLGHDRDRGSSACSGQRAIGSPYRSDSAHQVAKSTQALRPRARRTPRARPAGPASGAGRRRSQGRLLGLPDARPGRARRASRLSPRIASADHSSDRPVRGGHVGDLGDVLDPQVHRVDEPSGDRQVRRRLHRRDGLGRVQRVDQHEVGAVGAGAPGGQLAQVGEVTEPPRTLRPHRVQLGHEPPTTAVAQPGGQLQPGRGHDERALHLAADVTGRAPCASRAAGRRGRRRSPRRSSGRRPRAGRSTGRPAGSGRRPPASRSIHTSTGVPCGTCTGIREEVPSRTTTTSGRTRRHGWFRACSSDRATVASSSAATSSAARTATIVLPRHDRVLPAPVPVLGRDPVGVRELDDLRRRKLVGHHVAHHGGHRRRPRRAGPARRPARRRARRRARRPGHRERGRRRRHRRGEQRGFGPRVLPRSAGRRRLSRSGPRPGAVGRFARWGHDRKSCQTPTLPKATLRPATYADFP